MTEAQDVVTNVDACGEAAEFHLIFHPTGGGQEHIHLLWI